MTSNEELRKIASDFFEEIWNQKLEASIDKFIAADAAGNDPKFGVGRESFRTQWHEWIKAFPDLRFEVKEIIVEGNRVVTRWFLTGTHTGATFQGFPISGNKVGVDGISIDTIEGGMVTEGFDSWNQLLFRQQLSGGSTLGT
jgi:predicted ester cyclase